MFLKLRKTKLKKKKDRPSNKSTVVTHTEKVKGRIEQDTQDVFCVSFATEIPPDLHVFNKSTERECKQAEINGCCLGGERRKSQVRIKNPNTFV